MSFMRPLSRSAATRRPLSPPRTITASLVSNNKLPIHIRNRTASFGALRVFAIVFSCATAATLLLFLLDATMGFSSFFKFPGNQRTAAQKNYTTRGTSSASTPGFAFSATTTSRSSSSNDNIETVVTAALWSFFAGDALASPTHWFYGGFPQIQGLYGTQGITGYTRPVRELPGSILNKSNLSGGGRSGSSGGTNKNEKTIIGHVINHGKQDLWSPHRQIHYHATLQAGENTLEAQLARVLMRSIAATNGQFDADHFRRAYVDFMTTPGSHNDTYASTCHRMFFANWYYRKLPPARCPDNDRHNVDTVDGLVLPTVTAVAVAHRRDGTAAEAARQAAATAAVTRNSPSLEAHAAAWGRLVFATVRGQQSAADAAAALAHELRLRAPKVRAQDEITACYLDAAVPALLDTIVKYGGSSNNSHGNGNNNANDSVWRALLANANTGGENVHRGSCLGAVLGAAAAAANNSNEIVSITQQSSPLVTGLHDREALHREIGAFVRATAGAATAKE